MWRIACSSKKQANKKVKSSAQKLCKRDGCESKVHQISQIYCYKHSHRKYLCISCNVRSTVRNNLCNICDANGEQKVQNFCAQCKCRKVRNRNARCNICSMEDKCSKCKVRVPRCAGLLRASHALRPMVESGRNVSSAKTIYLDVRGDSVRVALRIAKRSLKHKTLFYYFIL